MNRFEIVMPNMGESIAEATIIKWNKKVGDAVRLDEIIAEIATDKVNSEIYAPANGFISNINFHVGDVVQVGDIIAIISSSLNDNSSNIDYTKVKNDDDDDIKKVATIHENEIQKIRENIITNNQSSKTVDKGYYSPLVKNIAKLENITEQELSNIKGSGLEGRITKDDILSYVKYRNDKKLNDQNISESLNELENFEKEIKNKQTDNSINSIINNFNEKQKQSFLKTLKEYDNESKPINNLESEVINNNNNYSSDFIELSNIQRIMSEHMIKSKHTAPHATTFIEVDLTNVVKWREKHKEIFEKREGTKLTFTAFFFDATIKALKDFPMINSTFISDKKIVLHKNINVGMATATPSGDLIVPVVHHGENKNLAGLAKSINDLSDRARKNALKIDEIQNGTFTITNIGQFDNVMGTPIINQPQSAILAVGAIKKKPAVIETQEGDVIAIRHLAYISLSFDHRHIGGALACSFLKRVSEYLENFDTTL